MQPHLNKPYAKLAEIDKEDNRAAARRIPEVMALVGLGLRQGKDGAPAAVPTSEVKAQLEQNIERLAEAEHDGWMEHRSRNGWRRAETRDDAKKLHPDMLPYAKLPECEKGKDRNITRHYPDFDPGPATGTADRTAWGQRVPSWLPDSTANLAVRSLLPQKDVPVRSNYFPVG